MDIEQEKNWQAVLIIISVYVCVYLSFCTDMSKSFKYESSLYTSNEG